MPDEAKIEPWMRDAAERLVKFVHDYEGGKIGSPAKNGVAVFTHLIAEAYRSRESAVSAGDRETKPDLSTRGSDADRSQHQLDMLTCRVRETKPEEK